MPSDVTAKINEVLRSYSSLKNLKVADIAELNDLQALFNNAAELEIDFRTAKDAAAALESLFKNIKDLAKGMADNSKTDDPPDGKPKKLTGGNPKRKSDLDGNLTKIGNRIEDEITFNNGVKQTTLSELNEQLDKLPSLGERPVTIAVQPSASSPMAGKSPAPVTTTGTGKGEDEGSVRMQEFFTKVTHSLISAQTELNQQSLDYAARLDRRIPPAYYSIPSLKAEMKVGFSESKDKGMNLILFSKKEQRENHGESTLSFELVSVPPPPGSDRPEPPPGFLLVGEEKKRFLDRVHELANAEQLVELTENFDNGMPLASILRYSVKVGEPKYLVFWPSQTKLDMEKDDFWRNMLVLHFSETDGKLQPDTSVFDKKWFPKLGKDNQYLLIPDTAGLTKLMDNPEGPTALINCFGDAVFKALTIFDEYYKAKV